MKKIISIIICAVLIGCTCTPAFADNGCSCGFSPIIYVGPLGCTPIIRDAGTPDEQKLWSIDKDFLLSNLESVLPEIGRGILTHNSDLIG